MARDTVQTPALFCLVVFLGVNYAIGYGIGHVLTGSTAGSIAIALIMPCLSLLGIALLKSGRDRFGRRRSRLDEA